MRKVVLSLASVIAVSCIVSCDNRPKGLLSEKEMVSLMTDMKMTEAYSEMEFGSMSDSVRYVMALSVMEKHGTNKAQLDSTLKWYGRNMDLYDQLYAKVDKELLKRQRSVAGVKDDAETVNLWPYARHTFISENGTSNSLLFSILPNELDKGEILNWNVHSPVPVTMHGILGVDYTNGESAYSIRNFSSTKNMEFIVQTDTGKTVRRIYGSLNVYGSRELPIWLDSISLTTKPYDSTEYYKVGMLRHNYGPHKRIKVKLVEKDSGYLSEKELGRMPENKIEQSVREGKVSPQTIQKYSGVNM